LGLVKEDFLVREVYFANIDRNSETFELDNAETSHILKVKRHKTGDLLDIVDGKGTRLTLKITTTTPLSFQVQNKTHEIPRTRFVAVIPLLKGDRMIQAVENAVELGATDLIFWQANRSIAKWADEKTTQKALLKMHNLIVKSGKQSRRAYFPAVLGAFTTKQLLNYLEQLENARVVVLHESASRHIGERPADQAEFTVLVVGPEGGISDDELLGFEKLHAEVYKVSDCVLRSATAISAGLALLCANLSSTD
jgi:16S rRNA (uracil1498-N3)-methyltransferase